MAQIVLKFCRSVGLLASVRLVVWYGKVRVPVAWGCCCCWPNSPAGHHRGGIADGMKHRQLSGMQQASPGIEVLETSQMQHSHMQAAASKGWQAASGVGTIQHSQEALQAAMSRHSHACTDSNSSSAHT